MTFSLTMPALGESVTEGTVTRWLKKEGDQIAVELGYRGYRDWETDRKSTRLNSSHRL